jgi:hypothetical protein
MRKLIISYLAVFLLYFINQDNVFSQTRTASGVYYKNKLKSSKSDCNVGFTADKTGPFCINNNDRKIIILLFMKMASR